MENTLEMTEKGKKTSRRRTQRRRELERMERKEGVSTRKKRRETARKQ